MKKMNLEDICRQPGMPICIQQAPIVKKTNSNIKTFFIDMPHLQTAKHRFRTYPKPISKIISL